MWYFLQNSFVATGLIGLCLYLWRLAYALSDWAVLALTPLALLLFFGFWRLMLYPWKAKLLIALREESPLAQFMTGKIRAALLSLAFTTIAVFILAWKALSVSASEAGILLSLIFVSGIVFSISQGFLERHLHQPFACATATSFSTWAVALPFTVLVAFWTWSNVVYPGAMIDATFREALQIGFDKLPDRGGWIAEGMAIPYVYESGKLWVVVQFKEYPFVAALFSLDTALFSIILARASIVVTQFIHSNSRDGA